MDNSSVLQHQVMAAAADRQVLRIRGSGSKEFYGYPVQGAVLDISAHSGIIDFQPTELVLTARAGTPMREIETEISKHNLMLGCEAPHFGINATLGGMIASGLSGPRRPHGGSVADLVLGCKILNGRGEILNYGGKVMKNVAGYDVSRLMVGSLGCLAVILEASIKLAPRPAAERTFQFTMEQGRVTTFLNRLTETGLPVSASCHDGRRLAVRFSSGVQEISNLRQVLEHQYGFMDISEMAGEEYWCNLREQRLEFFSAGKDIWRLSLAPDTKFDLPGATIVEWHGALRWLQTDTASEMIFATAGALYGSATLFRTGAPAVPVSIFQPLPPPLLAWHRQLKNAFDPASIFNSGRMYRGL